MRSNCKILWCLDCKILWRLAARLTSRNNGQGWVEHWIELRLNFFRLRLNFFGVQSHVPENRLGGPNFCPFFSQVFTREEENSSCQQGNKNVELPQDSKKPKDSTFWPKNMKDSQPCLLTSGHFLRSGQHSKYMMIKMKFHEISLVKLSPKNFEISKTRCV